MDVAENVDMNQEAAVTPNNAPAPNGVAEAKEECRVDGDAAAAPATDNIAGAENQEQQQGAEANAAPTAAAGAAAGEEAEKEEEPAQEAAEEEAMDEEEDPTEEEEEQDAPVPAPPAVAKLSSIDTPAAAAYPSPDPAPVAAAARSSKLFSEEELVWWRLYMQSSSSRRLESRSRAPQNVWSPEERLLVESVSDGGLEEMRGRLLAMLSGVEYTLFTRAAAAAHHHREGCECIPVQSRRAASSRAASQATEPGTRRRVMTPDGDLVRTPRASSVRRDPSSPSPKALSRSATASSPRASSVARPGPPASHTAARASIVRGSSLCVTPPASSSAGGQHRASAVHPHSLRASTGRVQNGEVHEAHDPRTPRTTRTDLAGTPEPLQAVPGEVRAERLVTTNPTQRRPYVSRYQK